MNTEDIKGKKFNRLTAIKYIGCKKKRCLWLFRCDCGNEKIIRKSSVVNGLVKSCGCLRNEMVAKALGKHLKTTSRIYKTYQNMKARCLNKRNPKYCRYGARGIKICDEWLSDFSSFYNWAIENGYKDTLTIDRIDNDGNYCPENCRWVSIKEQTRNTSRTRYVNYRGEVISLPEISERFGKNVELVRQRVSRGWDLEKALKI